MSDDEIEQRLREWEQTDPAGHAFVQAMTDDELEGYLKRMGLL